MRTKQQIKADMEAIKQEIRYARAENESEQGMEMLYNALEELENELCTTGRYND